MNTSITKVTIDGYDGDDIYQYFNRYFKAEKEIVKGGCKGCAFYAYPDCYKTGRTAICNKEHIIFKTYVKETN